VSISEETATEPAMAIPPRPMSFPWVVGIPAILWGWAIWSCAEYWQGNPNYSYGWAVPILAAGFGLRRWVMMQPSPEPGGSARLPWSFVLPAALAAAVAAFALEYAREQVWHPIVVVWSISLLAVITTLGLLRWRRGSAGTRTELFPVLFFLTAVPWPPRLEQPITGNLMRWVAQATTELLHWGGIEAQASGGAIALRNGLVGITEACSGIRSLQAGIMFGLAMGEWFLLSGSRRIILLVSAIGLALLTNLARTLVLTLQAHEHGINSVEQVHDLVGNIVVTAMVAGVWILGRLLREKPTGESRWEFASLREVWLGPSSRALATVVVSLVVGLTGARIFSARLDARAASQTSPFFAPRTSDADRSGDIPKSVWTELHPSSGEYIRHRNDGLPKGGADCFHFFWKPSPWNRFALVHRPDVCMPGVGWSSVGGATAQEIELDGRRLRFHVFRFRRGNTHALELWGAWRNGEPVPMEYRAEQIIGAAPLPPSLQLEGKRRSATEIVSCSLISDGDEPSTEAALETLRAVFKYTGP
jgi:exosortase